MKTPLGHKFDGHASGLSVATLTYYLTRLFAESRCILLPVVLRVLQAHMQEQKDLVMCARILTSMLSLIKKEENGTAVSQGVIHVAQLPIKGVVFYPTTFKLGRPDVQEMQRPNFIMWLL